MQFCECRCAEAGIAVLQLWHLLRTPCSFCCTSCLTERCHPLHQVSQSHRCLCFSPADFPALIEDVQLTMLQIRDCWLDIMHCSHDHRSCNSLPAHDELSTCRTSLVSPEQPVLGIIARMWFANVVLSVLDCVTLSAGCRHHRLFACRLQLM